MSGCAIATLGLFQRVFFHRLFPFMERLSTRTGSILRGTVLFWIFDFSRAGFGSAILEPRKARIYTEALAGDLKPET